MKYFETKLILNIGLHPTILKFHPNSASFKRESIKITEYIVTSIYEALNNIFFELLHKYKKYVFIII